MYSIFRFHLYLYKNRLGRVNYRVVGALPQGRDTTSSLSVDWSLGPLNQHQGQDLWDTPLNPFTELKIETKEGEVTTIVVLLKVREV